MGCLNSRGILGSSLGRAEACGPITFWECEAADTCAILGHTYKLAAIGHTPIFTIHFQTILSLL